MDWCLCRPQQPPNQRHPPLFPRSSCSPRMIIHFICSLLVSSPGPRTPGRRLGGFRWTAWCHTEGISCPEPPRGHAVRPDCPGALAATAAPRAAPARPPAAPAAAACPRRCATMSSRMRLLARCASQHNDLLRPALRGHREKKEQSALMLCACMRVVV